MLLDDLRRLLPELRDQPAPLSSMGVETRSAFHH